MEAEKKLKCKNLCAYIQRMWDMKCMIIPMHDHTNNNWWHRKSNKKFGSHSKKTFNRFTTHDNYLEHQTLYGEYCSLKLET
jgi:hypothetical protein